MYLPYLMCGYAATVIVMLAGCYAISRTVPGLRGLRLLVWALSLSLLAVVLVALRSFAPAWMTILTAHEAVILAWLLIYSATVEILDVKASFLPWGVAILLAAGGGMCWFTYVHEELSPRILISTGCLAIYAAARAVVLFRYREPASDAGAPGYAHLSLVGALAWLQVLLVILQGVRALLTVKYPPSDIVHIDMMQAGFTYLNLILNAGGGFGLTWLALSMHRRDLHRIARTDGLTGLLNRRAFEEILARELARSNHMEKSLTVLLLDIDRFKDVNDLSARR
jgi:diguanylate cyclase with GGDEF domain